VKNIGITSVKSFKSIFKIGEIINRPTTNNAGAFTSGRIIINSVAKNKEKENCQVYPFREKR
jgi:hypothetical protein